MKNTKTLVLKAMEHAEGKKYTLAKRLSEISGRTVPPVTVYNWLAGTPVNPNLCHAIQVLTEGEVQVHELRPDVFPAPGQLLPTPEIVKGERHAGGD